MRELDTVMRGAWTLAIVAVLAVPAAGGQGAPADPGPSVAFEDRTVEGLVEPLGDPAIVAIDVEVGCDAAEAAGTVTEASLKAGPAPEGVDVLTAPSRLSWIAGEDDCPAPGERPFEGTFEVSLRLTGDVAAFEELRMPLTLNVTKAPPGPGDETARSWGPYEANLTFTAGYHDLYNVRAETKVQTPGLYEAARFPLTIDNLGNDETTYEVSVLQAPGDAAVWVQPASLTLPVEGTGTAEVIVESEALASARDETVHVDIEVTGHSTRAPDHTVRPSRVSLTAVFQSTQESPSPAGLLVPAGFVAAALAASRRSR